MKPQTGDHAVLTHNTANGYALTLSWASDGSRIFYDRETSGAPGGVFSVPALGGEERRVLEDAQRPEALPDGSLLVVRDNARRQRQIFRFWPDSGRIQPLPLLAEYTKGHFTSPIRGLPGGHEAIAFGSRVESGSLSGSESGDHLYLVNLDSLSVQRVPHGSLPDSALSNFAPTRDGKTILAYFDDGVTRKIVAIPASGSGRLRSLFSVTSGASGLDPGPDGSLYIDQGIIVSRLVRFNSDGGERETLATFSSLRSWSFGLLSDGQPVMELSIAGKERLMVVEKGKFPAPLAATQEETALPMGALGEGEAAVLVGPEPRQTIAIVTVANGSIARRIRFEKGPIFSLAGSADGKTIYCAAGGAIWAIPALHAGEPKIIHTGDRVAVDSSGQFLIVELLGTPANRLIRVPLGGGLEREVPHGEALIPADFIHPAAVSRDGHILTPLASQTANWPPGMTDLAGHYRQIPQNPLWDFHSMAWTPDGKIVAIANESQGSLWRFQPRPELQ